MRRSTYLHMSVPGRILPLYAVVTGRRPCCGAGWSTAHLDGCARHPWSGRTGGHLRDATDGTSSATADRLEDWCTSSRPETPAAERRPVRSA